jgi:hypothetical protein
MSGREPRVPPAQNTIVVVGGGCYGSYYVRQLRRAAAAGGLRAERILVVDRDPACMVATQVDASSALRVDVVVREWADFFDEYLTAAVDSPATFGRDAIVPSPLMPHLMGEWLVTRARRRYGGRVSMLPLDAIPPVPWERAGADGTHYASFATWMCPVNCIEPRTCPHTRGARTWSMPETIMRHSAERSEASRQVLSAVMFCRHRTFGVGMFDTAEVVDADARIAGAAGRNAVDVIIGTVSHCHGALTRLHIDAAPIPARATAGSRLG